MSRIGKKPVQIPSGVSLQKEGDRVKVNGPKGALELSLPEGIELKESNQVVTVEQHSGDVATFGRIRSQLANCIHGVNEGWKRGLEIIGTGYRASTDGKTLTLALGFSHPVIIHAPEGVEFQVAQNKITVSGLDKQVVGETAAEIRRMRPPDSYKGKGVRFEGEYVRKKPGKTAKGAGGGA